MKDKNELVNDWNDFINASEDKDASKTIDGFIKQIEDFSKENGIDPEEFIKSFYACSLERILNEKQKDFKYTIGLEDAVDENGERGYKLVVKSKEKL